MEFEAEFCQLIKRSLYREHIVSEEAEKYLWLMHDILNEQLSVKNHLSTADYNKCLELITEDCCYFGNPDLKLTKEEVEHFKQKGIHIRKAYEYLRINGTLLKQLKDLKKDSEQWEQKKREQQEIKEKKQETGFGSGLTDYNRATLRKMVEQKKVGSAKTYINTYFAIDAMSTNIYYHIPSESKILCIQPNELKQYIPKMSKKEFELDPVNWVAHELDIRFFTVFKLDKPISYQENGKFYLNHYLGPLHKQPKPYEEYSQDVKDNVNIIWKHIQKVWCSNNEEMFKYTQRWIANMVAGKKMTTALYLKSIQGTGKSIITDFLSKKVIGKHNSIVSDDTSYYTGGFNVNLKGKRLLIIEELPCPNSSTWKNIGDGIKNIITGKTLTIKQKFQDDITYYNPLSVILLTNHDAVPMEGSDRRFVCLDVSVNKIGNHEYFNILVQATKKKIVGEAFQAFCNEFVQNDKPFNPQENKPVSVTKTENLLHNLHTFYVFLKREFLLKNKGIDKIPLTQLHKNYIEALSQDAHNLNSGKVSFYKRHDIKVSYREIGTLLRNLGFNKDNIKVGSGNKTFVEMSYEKLHLIFEKKGYLHDFDRDEIAETNEEYESEDYLDVLNNEKLPIIEVNTFKEPIEQPKQEDTLKELFDLHKKMMSTKKNFATYFNKIKEIEHIQENMIRDFVVSFSDKIILELDD